MKHFPRRGYREVISDNHLIRQKLPNSWVAVLLSSSFRLRNDLNPNDVWGVYVCDGSQDRPTATASSSVHTNGDLTATSQQTQGGSFRFYGEAGWSVIHDGNRFDGVHIIASSFDGERTLIQF